MISKTEQQVTLVRMPWDVIHRPSPAYGLIMGALEREGLTARILNANLWLSDAVGPAQFKRIADNTCWTLLPEFTFSKAAFPDYFTAETAAEMDGFPKSQLNLIRSNLGEDALELIARIRDEEAFKLCERVAEACIGAPVVGMSCTINQLVPVIAAARMIKAMSPETKVLLGGAQVEGEMGDEALRVAPWIDAVYKGEAELGVVETVQYLLGERDRPPEEYVSYRKGDGELHEAPGGALVTDMNSLPSPNYDDYFSEIEARQGTEHEVRCLHLPYVSSRGCWWGEKLHCTFCGLNGNGMVYRARDPEVVFEELEWLSRRYSKLVFIGMDNILPQQYLKSLLPMLRDSELDLRLFCETKANLKRRDVELYANAGLTLVQPGIESLSDNTLKIMRKGVTAIQNIYLLKLAAEYGVQLQWNVLCGFPGETEDEYTNQLDLFPKLWHLPPPAGASWFGVQRFSPFHFEPENLGIRNLRALHSYRYLFPVDRIDVNRLAFYFAFDYEDDYAIEDRLKLELRDAAREWQRRPMIEGATPTLSYLRGPGFVEITDTRAAQSPVKHMLTGVECNVFRAADDIVGVAELEKLVGDADRTREAIEGLAEMGLIYTDGKRVLNLALPASTKTHPKRGSITPKYLRDEAGTSHQKIEESRARGREHDQHTLESIKDGLQFI